MARTICPFGGPRRGIALPPRCKACRETCRLSGKPVREQRPFKDAISLTGSDLINNLPLEILVKIFSLLDLATLLLAQGVCRHWQSLISGVPSLQSALFFLPNLAPPSPVATEWPRSLTPNYIGAFQRQEPINPPFFHGHHFNPLLGRLFSQLFMEITFCASYRGKRPSYTQSISNALGRLPWAAEPDAVLRPEASWRRMLPAYGPGVRKLTVIPKSVLPDQEDLNYSDWWPRERPFFEVDFSAPSNKKNGEPAWMTMGAYYDILLEGMSWETYAVDHWTLLAGVRFTGRRNTDQEQPRESECSISNYFHFESSWLEPCNSGKDVEEAVLLVSKWHTGERPQSENDGKDQWLCESGGRKIKIDVRDVSELEAEKIWIASVI